MHHRSKLNLSRESSISLCGAARIPSLLGTELEQQVVELLPQNYSVAKALKTARLQGPFRVPKLAETLNLSFGR